ncbi:MAG: RNA polymerase sigma factor [Pseudomonadota bacterium]
MRQEEKLLIRWLTQKLGDPDSARDVVQSVFLRVWAFAENGVVENPRALLFKTAGNLALNELKRRNRFTRRHIEPGTTSENDPLHNVASSSPSPEKQASLREDVSITMAAIEALPDRPRRAFMMNRFDGLSYKEIAALMNVSESSVEKYMIEALKKLRSSMNEVALGKSKVIKFARVQRSRISG